MSAFLVIMLAVWVVAGLFLLFARATPVFAAQVDPTVGGCVIIVFLLVSVLLAAMTLFLLQQFLMGGAA